MWIDLQHEDVLGLASETWDTSTTQVPTAVLPVRRASAHVQKNITGRSRSTGKERDTESGNDYCGSLEPSFVAR